MPRALRLLTAVLFLQAVLVPFAKADTVTTITSAATCNDSVDWLQNVTWHQIPPSVYNRSGDAVSSNGVGVNVSLRTVANNYMAIIDDRKTKVLYVTDPVKFKFDEGISGLGLQITYPTYHGVNYVNYFSAIMTAFDSTGRSLGSARVGPEGGGYSGTFLGLQDLTGPNISSVNLSVSYEVWPSDWTDFEMGKLYLNTPSDSVPPVPEPSSLLLFASGLAGFAGLMLKRMFA